MTSGAAAATAAVGLIAGRRRRVLRRREPQRLAGGGRCLGQRLRGGAAGQRLAVAMRAEAEAEVVGGFVSACSMAEKWEDAVDEVAEKLGTGYDAGFVFVSELHVTVAQGLAPVVERLRERLGVRTLVGCAANGCIGQAAGPAALQHGGGSADGGDWPPIEVERGGVISVGLLREADATPFFLGANAQGDRELLNRKAAEKNVRSILLISDPFAPVESMIRTLDESFPNAVKAGGISAALQVGAAERGAFTPSLAIASEGCKVRLLNEGLVGLLLTDIDVHTVVCQGCCGVGPPVQVTEVQGPVCSGIGGRPAQETLQLIFSSVDPPMREKMQRFLTIGLGNVGESEGSLGDGDWLIRGISGVTPEGGLVIGQGIEAGKPLRFHVRDRESAENDLALMMKRYRLEKTFREGLGEPLGCLLFTCNGRGEGLYGRRHVDARAVADALGDACGTRVAGFFCNGEIGSPGLVIPAGAAGPDSDGEAPAARGVALHGFTAVFAVLVRTPKK